MTLREAMIQAVKERGYPDDAIEYALSISDVIKPKGCAESITREIIPGKEKEVIELLKSATTENSNRAYALSLPVSNSN